MSWIPDFWWIPDWRPLAALIVLAKIRQIGFLALKCLFLLAFFLFLLLLPFVSCVLYA
jgi:hypothetical protein